MKFEIPVLLLIFNRPELTRITFERIMHLKPRFLYIAADGPRLTMNEDMEKCRQTRDVVMNNIDWDCEVRTLFHETNLGCGIAVSMAIRWFFENVERGIIIEDDILPDLSFFRFCEELLIKYNDNEKIMHISGLNVAGSWKNPHSYFFSKFGSVWGWATWKRAWKHYDFEISAWENKLFQDKILQLFPDEVKENRKNLYDDLFNKKIDTWDYQWTFARLLNSGISIIPSNNLIANIGCGPNATHTIHINHPQANLEITPMPLSLNHPETLLIEEKYDLFHLGVKEKRGND